MTTFHDKSSGLQFTFSKNWSDLTQFDEHPDVRNFAKGLSCVDFAGLLSEEKLVLIEAKNFKKRPVEEHQSIFQRLGSREKGSPVVDEVAENLKDFVVFVAYLSQKSPVPEAETWETYCSHLLEKEIVCVLWLELDNALTNGVLFKRTFAHRGILTDLLQNKLTWLTEARNVVVASQVNQYTNPFGKDVEVSFLADHT